MKISHPKFVGERRRAADGSGKVLTRPWLYECCFAVELVPLYAFYLLGQRRLSCRVERLSTDFLRKHLAFSQRLPQLEILLYTIRICPFLMYYPVDSLHLGEGRGYIQ